MMLFLCIIIHLYYTTIYYYTIIVTMKSDAVNSEKCPKNPLSNKTTKPNSNYYILHTII